MSPCCERCTSTTSSVGAFAGGSSAGSTSGGGEAALRMLGSIVNILSLNPAEHPFVAPNNRLLRSDWLDSLISAGFARPCEPVADIGGPLPSTPLAPHEIPEAPLFGG